MKSQKRNIVWLLKLLGWVAMSKNTNHKISIELLLKEALVPEEEQPCRIPNNWVWVKLGEVVSSIKGKKPKELLNSEEEETIPYITISYMENGKNSVTQYLYKSHSKVECKTEEILMVWDGARSGLVGKGVSGEVGSTLVKLKITNLFPNYLFYFLVSKYNFIKKNHRGTGIPHVNPEVLWNIAFPTPPLNEQKRIADKVERLLRKIEEAKQLIEEARETLKLQYKTVLSKAFSGELTVKWRECIGISLKREEFVSQLKAERIKLCKGEKEIDYYNESFKDLLEQSSNIPDSWVVATFELICDNITKGTTPKTTDITNEGDIPYLKVYNIVDNKIDFEYKPGFIPRNIHETNLKRSKVYPNDVLMNIVGPPLGKVAIVPSTYAEWNINQAIAIFRPIKGVLSEYIYYSLLYERTLSEVFQATRGVVGQSNISLVQCRNLKVALPQFQEQVEIVNKINSTFEKLKVVENNISKLVSLFNKIEEAVLQKAFRGKLGTNDPSEENAIELLKKVLQEQVN
jgi:type I restriction enzyme S subunit